ncbi:MAG: peptidase M28, partial [Acidobacteria bacterium]|nr:peptidase M28 [Acidobacteriota bacterium]
MSVDTSVQFRDHAAEREALNAISVDEADALLRRFSTLVRESGSADERTAGEYIAGRLRGLGIPLTVHDPQLYLSVPERAELRVAAPGPARLVEARPPAFGLSTGGDEISGELVYVPSRYAGGPGDLFDLPTAAESRGGADPVAGKIVLTEGYSMPGTVRAFEQRGAIAQVYIHPGRRIHEGICTTIWGAPDAESIARKPRVPVVCVNHPDGEALAAAAAAEGGGLRVAIRTWLREGWAPCLLPVAEIRGQEDPDEFLLVHGHYDSW